MKALSVRQPWAWLIFHGKDIENRTEGFPGKGYRGPLLIHASKGMTEEEYWICEEFVERVDDGEIVLPKFKELQRGGIVGECVVTDCVRSSSSVWFTGPVGLVLAQQKARPFQACRGALGIFEVAVEQELGI